jgi:hypothetical protein
MAPAPTLNPLAKRLAVLRRRLRFVILLRGVAWLLAIVVLVLLVEGALDWLLHLPGVVRAFFLVATLGVAGCVGYVYLIHPLRKRDDDLALALQVEQHYPELNDCLASSVQFLQAPENTDPSHSETMRRAAIGHTLKQTRGYDFNRIVDGRGVRLASVCMMLAAALGLTILLWQPEGVRTALARLAHPFGSLEWPPQTRLSLEPYRPRVARGEPFEIRANLQGVVPERATVRFWFDGSLPSEQVHTITRSENLDAGALRVRLEPLRVQKSFRFQVQANDGITPWQSVSVLPPVALVPLGGRPSPQVRLHFPRYTDLPAQDLTPGSANIEAVLGTRVTLRAATDRPVSAAWLEYHPDQPTQKLAHFLGLLAVRHGGEIASLIGAGRTVWSRIPVQLQPLAPGSVLQFDFQPWVSGTYALRLTDADQLTTTRLVDVRVFPDPPPSVALERPSASHDSLAVLPHAIVTVGVVAEDSLYAVRTVWLEVRTRSTSSPLEGEGMGGGPRRPLYNHQTLGAVLPWLQSALASSLGAGLPTPPTAPLRLRPVRLEIGQRLSLKQLQHPDGRPLREGDVLVLQTCADDFDDVTANKPPGKSHEIELRIVSLLALEALLHHSQEQVQQELQRLREQQRDALKKVDAVEKQWRNTGKLRLEDLDNLLQAEQQQQQIRGRIGTKEEGLQAEVAKIQQTLRDNQLPRSSAHERMEMVAQELERLGREELEQIEPLLTAARKENELAQENVKPDKRARGSLTQAVQHQEEVERTLSDLLASLDPFSSGRQARAEAKALLQEQRKLNAETEKLGNDVPKGQDPKPEDRAELDKAGSAQERLAEQARELLNKMDRIVAEKLRQAEEKAAQSKEKAKLQEEKGAEAEKLRETNPAKAQQLAEEARALRRDAEALQEAAQTLKEEAATLEQSASAGRSADVEKQMQQAAKDIKDNKLGKAGQEQQESTKALEKMARALEDRRAEELDKLAKKLGQAERDLEKLVEEQDRLKTKIKEAQKLEDPKEREEALQRLAREQEKLRKETRELAQQLSRMRAGKASQSLRDAGGQMDQAGQMLERGEDAQEQEEEALERLKDALEDLQDAREDAEEELAREKLFKIAEQLKLLKERQEAQLPESERIHREILQKKLWDLALRGSLLRQADAQEALGKDTQALAESKLKDAEVFAHMLRKSAKAMEQAMQSIKDRIVKADDQADGKVDAAALEAAYQKTAKLQREAVNYLEQLLAALKPEEGMRLAGNGQGDGKNGGGKGGPEGDGIPEIAQLKLLKSLQEDVTKRTEEFARQHPDSAKLTDQEKQELANIRQDQADIAKLVDSLTPPAKPEGDKP